MIEAGMGDCIPEVMLNSGHRMPLIGMGTAMRPMAPEDVVLLALLDAVRAGYRHFDTAAIYGSEAYLGKAIATAIEQGMARSRDEFFITSKLWCTDTYPEGVLPALKKTLKNLQLEYLDLYLIHLPIRKSTEEPLFGRESSVVMDFRGTWAAMEECQRLGLTKSIGVSNFTCKKLNHLLSTANIRPAVNQVEMHPMWHQRKLLEFCTNMGIHLTAYSPLGGISNYWGSNVVMESQVLKDIAQAKGRTVAQVCLRWALEQGVSLVAKSFNKERMKENLGILDWQLNKEELDTIRSLPQTRIVTGLQFVRTLEDLWDDEA